MKTKLALFSGALILIGGFTYLGFRTPDGVVPKSEGSDTIAWIGLAAAITGFATAIVGLIDTILKLKGSQSAGKE